MDRNGLVYADLNLLEEPSPSRLPPPCQPQGFFKDSSAHLTVLKLLASGIIILTAAVIGLSIWDPEPQNCPPQWKFHQGKCYLFSRGEKNWNESKADCTKKESSMLVIQDVRDLEFVQNTIFEGALFWIGLRAASLETAWTWVDHSPYNQLLFKITGNRNGEVCVQLSKKMAYSENCESEINWICQKNVSS